MYIAFTYRCPSCGHTEDRFVRKPYMDFQHCTQPGPAGPCATKLIRLPAGTRTTFRFADRRLKR